MELDGAHFVLLAVSLAAYEAADSRKGVLRLNRTRLPDYSIGATVLIVAIALPVFMLTRAVHLHRHSTTAQVRLTTPVAEIMTPTVDPSASAPPQAGAPMLPQTAATATPHAKASARSGRIAPVRTAAPTSHPTSSPTPTQTVTPVGAPVAIFTWAQTGVLTISVDASGSSDTAQTPITQIWVDFGDGSGKVLAAGGQAEHTYATSGPYQITVVVIDSTRASATAVQPVNVS